MAHLNDGIKAEIVTRLAQFERPCEIARTISADYHVAVDRFQVRSYDPTKPTYAAGDKWKTVFDQVRQTYLESVASIPIAQKAYRLNELQKNYEAARSQRNLILANATLEQAAKEAGGAMTNERSVTISNRPHDTTPEERRAQFAELIRKALDLEEPAGTRQD